ncbi:uncharacterized protein [Dendropsophus ebraccatus]|uniref:uncharacterized protein isoform X2 n=1 Tax=Dendropsophus ebraccatus TaxID=150705 RepID=UPI003831E1A5
MRQLVPTAFYKAAVLRVQCIQSAGVDRFVNNFPWWQFKRSSEEKYAARRSMQLSFLIDVAPPRKEQQAWLKIPSERTALQLQEGILTKRYWGSHTNFKMLDDFHHTEYKSTGQSDNLATIYYVNKQGGTSSSDEIVRTADDLGRIPSYGFEGGTHSGQTEFQSRLVEQTPSCFRRVESSSRILRLDCEPIRSARHRHHGNQTEQEFAQILLHMQMEQPRSDRWPISTLDLLPYIFPPLPLIPRVLGKIQEEQTTAIVVVPYWPRRAWFPLILKGNSG